MDEHARGIQNASKRRPPRLRQLGGDAIDERPGIRTGLDFLADFVEHPSRRRDDELVRL